MPIWVIPCLGCGRSFAYRQDDRQFPQPWRAADGSVASVFPCGSGRDGAMGRQFGSARRRVKFGGQWPRGPKGNKNPGFS